MERSEVDMAREKRQHKRFSVKRDGLIGRLEDDRIVDIIDLSVGGIAMKAGSRLVVGPKDKTEKPIEPMERILDDVHEAAGVGTLFPDKEGKPMLHMHIACGRESSTTTGCIRRGVRAWQVMELVLLELVGSPATRQLDEELGFQLLQP